jgi:putative oxidoreductase
MSRYGATLLRVTLGVIFAMNGYFALFVLEPAGAAQLIRIPGLPLGEALAWYLIVAHIVGGLMLVVGLKTRWAALANIPVILIALSQLHTYQSFLITCAVVEGTAGKFHPVGLEYPLLVLAATAALVLQGGGALAMTDDQ